MSDRVHIFHRTVGHRQPVRVLEISDDGACPFDGQPPGSAHGDADGGGNGTVVEQRCIS
jgi:hypothetical protein